MGKADEGSHGAEVSLTQPSSGTLVGLQNRTDGRETCQSRRTLLNAPEISVLRLDSWKHGRSGESCQTLRLRQTLSRDNTVNGGSPPDQPTKLHDGDAGARASRPIATSTSTLSCGPSRGQFPTNFSVVRQSNQPDLAHVRLLAVVHGPGAAVFPGGPDHSQVGRRGGIPTSRTTPLDVGLVDLLRLDGAFATVSPEPRSQRTPGGSGTPELRGLFWAMQTELRGSDR